MLLSEIRPGNNFRYAGRTWTLLNRIEDRNLCLSVEGEGSGQYDRGMEARFDKASLGRWLNDQYYQMLLRDGGSAADFTPILMNLAISGIGDCVHGLHAGLLSWKQWLRYSDRIPPIHAWQWSCSLAEGIRGLGLRCMVGSGRSGYAYFQPNQRDPIVRPAISLLNSAEVRSEE